MRVIGTDKNGDEIAEVSVTELDTMFKEIRANAIDEMVEGIREILEYNAIYNIDGITTLAEQLKAGGKNE
jgi:hypothetical protein